MGIPEPKKLSNYGRKPIEIDISFNDFYTDPIGNTQKFLAECVKQQKDIVSDCEVIEDEYLGKQAILNKSRDDGSQINNKVVENRLWEIVNFHKGFMVGRPIEYSYKGAINTDDMTYFKRYLQDSKKASKDVDLYEDKYKYGTSYRMIISKRTDFDSEEESPFEILNLDIKSAFVAHSSSTEKQVLFGCIISKKYIDENTTNDLYTIYLTDGTYFELETEGTDFDNATIGARTKQSFDFCPIIECPLNKQRIGLVELVLYLQNSINGISSTQSDDLEQFVNSYLLFEHVEVDEEFTKNLLELKKQRIIAIKTNNPQTPAKVSMLQQTLDHDKVNNYYQRLIDAMFDITATPKASGSVASGGDTTGARLLGNGWESAQNMAEVDSSFMIANEYDQLKMMFKICKFLPNNKIDNLHASDIDIKYNINMSNNLLVKTQSLSNLYTMNMPKEQALNIVGLTADAHGVATIWEEADKVAKSSETTSQDQELVEQKATSEALINSSISGV
jgi:SPP1 family phage portal protein